MRTIADYFRLNPDTVAQFRYVRSLYSALVEVFGDPDRVIPIPSKIRFSGSAHHQYGFPVVANPRLRAALQAYAEEETRYLAKHILKARTRDPGLRIEAGPRIETKTAYEKLLGQVLEAATIHGASYRAPELFWLYHSGDIAMAVALCGKTVASVDTALVGSDGVHIKYRLLRAITGLLLDLIHATNARIALDASFDQTATAPPVVQMLMRNTLLLSNLPGPLTLGDVDDYLGGVVRTDTAKFHRELDALRQYLLKECRSDPRLYEAVRSAHPEVKSPADVSMDSVLIGEQTGRLVQLQKTGAPHQNVLGILAQLRPRFVEYEIVHHLRTLMLECARKTEDTGKTFTERIVLESDPAQVIDTTDTRVFDFNRPSIVENRLERFGLVYDINNFTATYSDIIRQHSSLKERQSVRQMYAFQQVISGLSDRFGIRFEKFLGDGSFFTSRRAGDLVNAASVIQEAYVKARRDGFVFDRGIRIALNHNHYYVIPLQFDGSMGSWTHDYLGSGLIELTRLTTGKTLTNLPELKNWLVAAGYTPDDVDAFLNRPSQDGGVSQTSAVPAGAARDYWVEVTPKGELRNEGIALTTGFLDRLAQEVSRMPLLSVRYGGLEWTGYKAADINRYHVFRFAGVARLKGLEPMPVAEMASLEPEHAGQAYEILKPRVRGNLHDLVLGSAKAEDEPETPADEPGETTGPITEVSLPEETICYFSYQPDGSGSPLFYLGRVGPGRRGLVNALSTPHDLTRMDPKRLLAFYTSFEQNPEQEKETVSFESYGDAAQNIRTVQVAAG